MDLKDKKSNHKDKMNERHKRNKRAKNEFKYNNLI